MRRVYGIDAGQAEAFDLGVASLLERADVQIVA